MTWSIIEVLLYAVLYAVVAVLVGAVHHSWVNRIDRQRQYEFFVVSKSATIGLFWPISLVLLTTYVVASIILGVPLVHLSRWLTQHTIDRQPRR